MFSGNNEIKFIDFGFAIVQNKKKAEMDVAGIFMSRLSV